MANPSSEALQRLIEPVLQQGNQLTNPPHAYLIEPGNDWPADVARPPEPMVFIPRIPDAVKRRIPKDVMREIESTARDIVKDMGLPQDITLAEVMELKSKPAPEVTQGTEGKTAIQPPKKSGFGQRMVATTLLAGAGLLGQGELAPQHHAHRPPAAVSTLEGIGSEQQRRGHASNRKGATLVELLVVIGIIAVLAGLTFPAVQQARESAREIQFKSNMHQVGVAIQNFESTHNKLPYATSMLRSDKGAMVPHSWVVDILPFLDQSALYAKYDQRKPHDEQSAEVQNAIIPVLNHPSYNAEPGRMHMAALSSSGYSATNPPDIEAQNGIAKDYLLNRESQDDHVAMPAQWVMMPGGQWRQNAQASMANITDGASNTAIIAAHCHEEGNRDPWLTGKTRITGLMFGVEVGQSRVNGGLLGNVSQKANYVTNHVISHGGLRHPENHKVLFADGSVRNVAPTGTPGASWGTDAAQRWRDMVRRDDGKSPPDSLTP